MEIRPATWDDLAVSYDIRAAYDTALFGEPEFRLEHMENFWRVPSFEPARDAWVAVGPGSRPVGHASLLLEDAFGVWVHPEHRGRGVGSALLRAVEEGARGRRAVLQTVVCTLDEAAGPLLARAGYAGVEEILRMGIELDEPPPGPGWPAGVVARTFRPGEDDRAVHALLDEAYAWDPRYLSVPFADWRQWMLGDPSFDAEVWFLAVAGDELAGAALNWREGWVKDLVVKPSWRRRGLGEALMRHTFATFYGRGLRWVGLKVIADNPTGAVRLYERVGMRLDRSYEVYEKRFS